MNKKFYGVSSAVILLLAGCASDSAPVGRAEEARDMAVPRARAYAARNTAPRMNRSAGTNRTTGNFNVPAGHQMAFTAHLRISVGNVREAVDQARELAMKLGGYVKRMDDNSVTLAIPVGKADEALTALKKSGVLISQRIEGEDVTRQVTDIAVRMENLEKSRKRLLSLLEKAGKVEEMVKVETAITRVTTELERLQAQQKNLRTRVDYVTMYVTFVAAVTRHIPHNTSPIGWVNALGSNLLAFNQQIVNNDDSLIIDLALPSGFVKNGTAGAVSGNNCIIELARYNNAVTATHWYGNDYAGMGFYAPMIEKALGERFKVPVAVSPCKIDKYDAVVYTVKPVIGKVSYTYRVAVTVVKSKVMVISARARSIDFNKALPDDAWRKMLDSADF